jgi:hypothetical protein
VDGRPGVGVAEPSYSRLSPVQEELRVPAGLVPE